MTIHDLRPASPGQPADLGPVLPHGPDPRHIVTLEEAEHVLRGMWALEPDYFYALVAEVRMGRPLNLGAISKARKGATTPTADAG